MTKIINVTNESDPAEVGRELARALRDGDDVTIQAPDAAGVRQLRSAVSQAQDLLKDEGLAITVHRDTGDTAAIGMIVSARSADATTPERRETSAGTIADWQVAEDFEERQDMLSGENELLEQLLEHNAESPILSGGDVDAAWDQANDAGEETVGGSVSTPDQDNVDDLGEAAGLTYEPEEPLDTDAKLEYRDEHRWELDPRSAEDEEDEA